MSLPFISAITVTFGRTQFLSESIAAFLAQDYKGPCEMVVLNTCPEQTLLLESEPKVRIVNLKERPASLGESRNKAIELAAGTHIVVWDDDDIPLAHHLRTFAENFLDKDWLLLNAQCYMEGDVIKAITEGACHMMAYTKEAWRKVNGYPALGCGEDRRLVSAIANHFPGRKIVPPIPTFIYRWGQGTYHASGEGYDREGLKPVHLRVAEDL